MITVQCPVCSTEVEVTAGGAVTGHTGPDDKRCKGSGKRVSARSISLLKSAAPVDPPPEEKPPSPTLEEAAATVEALRANDTGPGLTIEASAFLGSGANGEIGPPLDAGDLDDVAADLEAAIDSNPGGAVVEVIPGAPVPVGVYRVPLAAIDAGDSTQSRAALDPATVEDYREKMARGVEFPPVILFWDGHDYWLADGFHRAAAARAHVGTDGAILADVREGTFRDALRFAISANVAHGLPMNNADKRRVVSLILGDEEWSKWSDREIARATGVSNTFVGNMRRELDGSPSFHDQHRIAGDGNGPERFDRGDRDDDDDDKPARDKPARDTERIERDTMGAPPGGGDAAPPVDGLPDDERAPFDAYYTPNRHALASIFQVFEDLGLGMEIEDAIEPAVGSGNWCGSLRRVVRSFGREIQIDRVDINPEAPGLIIEGTKADGSPLDDVAIVGDFLTLPMHSGRHGYDLVIGNPPYLDGIVQWVERALEWAPIVVFLLRGTILGSKARYSWWTGAGRPSHIYTLSPRPKWEGPGARPGSDSSDPVLVVWDHRKGVPLFTSHNWISVPEDEDQAPPPEDAGAVEAPVEVPAAPVAPPVEDAAKGKRKGKGKGKADAPPADPPAPPEPAPVVEVVKRKRKPTKAEAAAAALEKLGGEIDAPFVDAESVITSSTEGPSTVDTAGDLS